MANENIVIKGARVNNLKNIDITLPRNKLIVMTGLSGSGKTSLAFDTIYAEGQRRYVESLSSYARQFLGGIEKPDVDLIEGLSPSIAIDQKTTSNNPRSTVGTITEIYDYLRLLYARCGESYCPNHHILIKAMSTSKMVEKVMEYPLSSRIEILANVVTNRKGTFKDLFEKLKNEGFLRLYVDNELRSLDEEIVLDKNKRHDIDVVVDRIVVKENIETRLNDSIELALKLADGTCIIKCGDKRELLSSNYACPDCGFTVPKLEPRLFSFNSPLGACDMCKGLGIVTEVDVDYLIPDKSKSINEGGIRYYKNIVDTPNLEWQNFNALLKAYKIDKDKPLGDFTKKEMEIILYGSDKPIKYDVVSSGGTKYSKNDYIEGVKSLIERRYVETTSKMSKEWYFSYMAESTCPKCHGARLNDAVLSVRINGLNIYEFTQMAIVDAYDFVEKLKLSKSQMEIARLLLVELKSRLKFLIDVGLDYLTLDRIAGSLSGGEAQRIRLATQIGSSLTGVLYVLDEPSIGLHQRDNDKLINSLKEMRDLGNTLIVVEHDEDTMRAADYLVDIGPGPGDQGGEVVAAGTPEEVMRNKNSLTGKYLTGELKIDVPKKRRKGNGKFIEIKGASQNNLKNINVKFPLGTMTLVTGVSGSGKSSLVTETLVRALRAKVYGTMVIPGKNKGIKGLENVDKVVDISQEPIGRTPRSNPATYVGVFDDIRDLFAEMKESKMKGYDKGRFSFNVKGGRCEACQGDGIKKIEMHFLPDVYVPCDVCHGTRYNRETLDVKFKGKNIAEVLDMRVSEAIEFFDSVPKIKNKLQTMIDVGLPYIKLGQSAPTLSGGEAARVKLAKELQKKPTGKSVFILDEPTTGLHTDDIKKLLVVLERIVDNGDTVIIIEHNLDVIKCADYIIDIGPNGGDDGGRVIAKGIPEEIVKVKESFTGEYLKSKLEEK